MCSENRNFPDSSEKSDCISLQYKYLPQLEALAIYPMVPKGQEKCLSLDLRQDANIALTLTLGKASMFSSEHIDEWNGPVPLNAGWIYVNIC